MIFSRSFMRLTLLILPILLVTAVPVQAKIKVVASFSILGDIVQQVAGDAIDLSVIVGPDSDTHVYEPKPADVQKMTEADVVIVNGLGFEGWQTRLTSASNFKGTVIVASDGIQADSMADDPLTTDPHAWQNVMFARRYADNIRDGLCKADAENCPLFTARAADYDSQLSTLDANIKSAISSVPSDRRIIITSHDAFGYFARAYGITVMAPEGINTESEASARDVAILIGQIRTYKVTTLFVENISDPRLMEQIGSETGVKIGEALYSDALSGPEGPASTYIAMMRHNLDLLSAAMNGK